MKSKEMYIAALLKDDDIRQAFVDQIKPWMFNQELPKILAKSLMNLLTFNKAHLRAEIAMFMSGIEIDSCFKMLDEIITPLMGDERRQAVSSILLFIKEKNFAKLVHDTSVNGFSLSTVERCGQLAGIGILGENIYDFTNPNDVSKARATMFPPGSNKVIKSSFSLINNALMLGGYSAGTISMFVARPGLGKTTMMLNEGLAALIQGLRVFHIFIGDMGPYDALAKYISCSKKELINKVVYKTENYLDPSMLDILSRLRVATHGAYAVNTDGVISEAKTMFRSFPFDMMIIDYDGNIAPTMGDNMYMSGGYMYGKFEQLAKDLRIPILIGCQTKIGFWQHEVVPMEGAAESSKKQHVVDMMVTLGKHPGTAPVGTMNIAKIRRGTPDVQMRIFLAGSKAWIREVHEDEYKRIIKQADNPDQKFQK